MKNQQQGGGCCVACETGRADFAGVRFWCAKPSRRCHQPTSEKQESQEGVEEILREFDDFWYKLYLPRTGKGPHKGKKERAKDWLRQKLTNLNTKKHE